MIRLYLKFLKKQHLHHVTGTASLRFKRAQNIERLYRVSVIDVSIIAVRSSLSTN